MCLNRVFVANTRNGSSMESKLLVAIATFARDRIDGGQIIETVSSFVKSLLQKGLNER